jgi:hypothetical protein
MIAPICFLLAARAPPFKSKSRLAAENAVLRQQLIAERSLPLSFPKTPQNAIVHRVTLKKSVEFSRRSRWAATQSVISAAAKS